MELLAIKRAILSVTDKNELDVLATFLHKNGVELVSTGGTKLFLESKGLPVTSVSTVTGFPEILGGRVKTLHPKIHAGILADKDNAEHLNTLNQLKIQPFDMVCINFYDFSRAVEDKISLIEAVEQIDIGGPCMLRAAAKNFHSVLALPSPEWYKDAMDELNENNMCVSLSFRQNMASKAFAASAKYDSIVTSFLS